MSDPISQAIAELRAKAEAISNAEGDAMLVAAFALMKVLSPAKVEELTRALRTLLVNSSLSEHQLMIITEALSSPLPSGDTTNG